MTRRRFIKQLISYGFKRKQIDAFAKVIIESGGKLSYDDSIKDIQMYYIRKIMSSAVKIPISNDIDLVKCINTKFSMQDAICTTYTFGTTIFKKEV